MTELIGSYSFSTICRIAHGDSLDRFVAGCSVSRGHFEGQNPFDWTLNRSRSRSSLSDIE
ncbi:hypothetical protein PGTUg99_003347 [Puccinia graminis f. sp. tritici]|nr:hypothetical protein PGTUg99_003347 [Puccinia graminis f. sp. tritici]